MIRDRIATDRPVATRRILVRFVNAFRLLARHPELGHTREDLLPASIRFWPAGECLILYLPENNPIEILAVVHGARDVPAIVNRRTE